MIKIFCKVLHLKIDLMYDPKIQNDLWGCDGMLMYSGVALGGIPLVGARNWSYNATSASKPSMHSEKYINAATDCVITAGIFCSWLSPDIVECGMVVKYARLEVVHLGAYLHVRLMNVADCGIPDNTCIMFSMRCRLWQASEQGSKD